MNKKSILSEETKNLILQHKELEGVRAKKKVSNIHVDEVASKVSSFYEKVRGVIDWKEEHLLKKGAIERSLKMRIFPQINLTNGKIISVNISAENLVLELIRSGHFPNDKIEESKISKIQEIIDKYIYIINQSLSKNDSQIQLMQWICSIAACEIEESLSPAIREQALIGFMYEKIKESLILSKSIQVTEGEKNIQVFIAVQKALFHLDSSMLTYSLIKYKYSSWKRLLRGDEKLKDVAINIHSIKEEMEDHLNHPLGGKIELLCEKYNTPYLLLNDIITDNPSTIEEKISDPSFLESIIKEKYNQRLLNLKSRLTRAAFYSTISIFITNIIALFAIEIPIARYFGEFSTTAYLVTIFVPTLLMAVLILAIDPPPKGNLEKVIMETMKIIYKNEKKDSYEIKSFRKKGVVFAFFISIIYLISFIISIGFMVWALSKINFPPFSYIVFIVFLSLIAFAGSKLRRKSKELHMIEEKEGFFITLVDFFALPVLLLGKWLTLRWKKYNIISIFFNAIIDMPFSIFVEFLEQWRYFLKEKKERL